MLINRLRSGGLITNYHCTSRCAHCLYNCGPNREKAYMYPEKAGENLSIIKKMECPSVHVGGGEPMLAPDALAPILETAREIGVGIDYVETNASWYTDHDSAVKTLSMLKAAGLHTLLVSISPFHNAAVPLSRTQGVLAACRETGIRVFPWIADFMKEMSQLDASKTHSLDEYRAHFGDNYLHSVLRRYWVHLGGRALASFRPILPTLTAEQIRLKHAKSCRAELSDTSHFHIDLYGNYIPGLCAGLAFPAHLLGHELDAERFPVLSLLWNTGIRGLLEWAQEKHGFIPRQQAYLEKCDLCNDIRSFLATKTEQACTAAFTELAPIGYYTDTLRSPPSPEITST